MKMVKYSKVKRGDLVEVPRTQFSQQRRGWNGWLFSNAIVLEKGKIKNPEQKFIKVEMYLPAPGKHNYNTKTARFNAEYVFQTTEPERSKRLLQEWGVTKENYEEFLLRDDVSDMSDLQFLVDKGFIFDEPAPEERGQKGKENAIL